jgi:hypothetical protein
MRGWRFDNESRAGKNVCLRHELLTTNVHPLALTRNAVRTFTLRDSDSMHTLIFLISSKLRVL